MKRISKHILALMTCCCMALLIIPTIAYADTDGTELQVTDHPEQLILQLGQEWAGVEFELKMELGGSQTYTLSAMHSSVPVPSASATQEEQNANDINEPAALEGSDAQPQPTSQEETSLIKGIPNTHLFLFGGGLIICVGALIAMRVVKQRRASQEDVEEYDDYEE